MGGVYLCCEGHGRFRNADHLNRHSGRLAMVTTAVFNCLLHDRQLVFQVHDCMGQYPPE